MYYYKKKGASSGSSGAVASEKLEKVRTGKNWTWSHIHHDSRVPVTARKRVVVGSSPVPNCPCLQADPPQQPLVVTPSMVFSARTPGWGVGYSVTSTPSTVLITTTPISLLRIHTLRTSSPTLASHPHPCPLGTQPITRIQINSVRLQPFRFLTVQTSGPDRLRFPTQLN